MAYDYGTLVTDLKDGVLELVLNRPEARNAIDHPMQNDIEAALDEAEVDPDVRSVLIRGEGQAFSAGHDLKEATDPSYTGKLFPQEGFPVDSPSRGQIFQRAWYFRKPLICGVHGYVGPGATTLVCCADFVIAADNTRFGFEIFRKHGTAPSWFWLPMYVQLPMRVMEKIFLMGGWLGAEEAHQFQFVQRVVPQDELVNEARRWAQQTAMISSESFGHAKDQIRRAYEAMGLSAVHTTLARYGPPRPERPTMEALIHEGGIHAALRERDAGVDDDISRV